MKPPRRAVFLKWLTPHRAQIAAAQAQEEQAPNGHGRPLGIAAPGAGTAASPRVEQPRPEGATTGSARVERPRPDGGTGGRAGHPRGSRLDRVRAHWGPRLLVAISMMAGLVGANIAAAPPAAAAPPVVALWSQPTLSTSPPARSAASVAYDAGTGQTVLFGGYNGSSYLNDTWAWNSTTGTWAQVDDTADPACTTTCTTSPSVRSGAVLAYDPATDQLVLFGGYNGSAWLADTWTWTGTTWSQLAPATSPTGRTAASFGYDSSSGQMLLFGGQAAASTYDQDTWTWSGTTWTALSPATKPAAREESTLAYDTSSGQMVLFGGWNGSSAVNDTWNWTGSNWALLSPGASPTARYGASLAYLPAISQLVLSGGNGGTYDSDTWAWNGTTWPSSPRRAPRRPGRWRPWPTCRPPARCSCSAAPTAAP